ncbi:DASH family cryptochrome [Robertkochia aurantiaca]|uniref:DASH family cryptochrome n=1 Tax=Robertkochia aurantiaca TaxID=2873700 RepID=UPI001CC95811|nr:DASH family cryptochrome [Robertkochia sp. 3YJGBD-33]
MQKTEEKTVMVWFRNDLRASDQASLSEAINSGHAVIGVYFLDPRHYRETRYGFNKTGYFRTRFLLETLRELRDSLAELNIPLIIEKGKPEELLPQLSDTYNITEVHLQREWTSEELAVSEKVKAQLHIPVKEHFDQFLFHPDDIPYENFDQIPEVFTAFRKTLEKQSPVRPVQNIGKPKKSISLNKSDIPEPEELGLESRITDHRTAFPFRGGMKQAKKRLEYYIWDTQKIKYYKKTRNGLVGTDYSSKFSPWLANGSLSPREIYHQIKKFEDRVAENQSTYWLIFELIWRDYFKYISLKHGDKIFHLGGIKNRDYDWERDEKKLESWISGSTAEPFVNANMIELRETGWMSNRGRQNVASYWAKELAQDWRIGAAYFESTLIDYDVHSNWGNWMYNSGVGNDPRDRKFNISSQAERYDSNGRFRRLWLQANIFRELA